MIQLAQSSTTTPTLDLARMRRAVPRYQWSELPRRLRKEWPYRVEETPSTEFPEEQETALADPSEYWHRRRAE